MPEGCSRRQFIEDFETARRLSVLKWNLLIEQPYNYSRVADHDVLGALDSDCGFCELYKSNCYALGGCSECPVNDHGNEICCLEHHEFWTTTHISSEYESDEEAIESVEYTEQKIERARYWATRLRDRIASLTPPED